MSKKRLYIVIIGFIICLFLIYVVVASNKNAKAIIASDEGNITRYQCDDEGIINYLGVDYTDVVVTADHTDEYSGWENDKNTYTVTLSACVPIGYDGLLIVLANDQVDWTYIYDLKGTDPLFFRFE